MTPTDWDADPELKLLRDEFIASFLERRRLLGVVLSELRTVRAMPSPQQTESLQLIVHKLAGAAESYGFASLTEVSAAMDDLLSEGIGPARLLQYVELLDHMLETAAKLRQDPVTFRSDPLFKELISAAE